VIDLKTLVSKNKTPKYYVVFILMAVVPQIFGFNASGLGDIWKMGVMLWLCFMFLTRNEGRFSYTGICFLVFFLLINVICLLADSNISFSTIINFGISILLVYLFFESPIREKNITEDDVLLFFRFFTIFMLISCVYNMIVNVRQLLNISSISVYSSDATASFFDNKNTFGVFLIFGAISATFLKVVDGNNKWMIVLAIFIVNEVMAMCRTAIVLTIFFLIVSFLVGDKKTYKKRIFSLIILIIAAMVFYCFVSPIRNFIDNNLFGNTDSLDTRDGYIERMLPLADGIYLFLGYGEEKSVQLAYEYAGNRYYHNTYLHLLMMGGLLKIVLFTITVLYAFNISVKVCKLNQKTGYMCIATIIAYLVYASIESVILFDTPVIAMLATIFVVSIPRLFLNAAVKNNKDD
jgi:hypothetical protein